MSNQAKITFNKGRLSPKIDSRVDYEGYDGGCRELDNMIPDQYGNAIRRPGTEYIASGTNLESIYGMLVAWENVEVCFENEPVVTGLDNIYSEIVCYENGIVCHENDIVDETGGLNFLARIVCHENDVVFYENKAVFI